MRLGRFALLLLLLSLGRHAPAQEPAPGTLTPERLARAWCGVFRWRGDDQDQNYTMAFTSVTRRTDGRIEASGPGRNRIVAPAAFRSRTVDMTVRAVIDPVTRNVEIWERTPSFVPDYWTDEPFVGTLAQDLQSMVLTSRWEKDRRLLGDMILHARPAHARPDEPCGVPSS
jgi:hypothetical protein